MAREDAMDGGLPRMPRNKKKLGMSPGAMSGRRSGMSPGAMSGPRKKTGPAKTIAEAKRRGLSTFTDKSGKKKAAVTAEELKKSGLSLRDYLNKQQGKTRAGPKAPTVTPKPKPTKPAAKKVMPNQKGITAPKPKAGSTPMIPLGSSGRRIVDEDRKKRAAAKTATNVGSGRTGTGGKGTPYMGMGMKAGGMKKGYSMGGMKKKGMAAGGLNAAIKMVDKQKKGMAAGGMKKKGFSMGGMKKKGMAMGGMKKSMKKGGKIRGAGIERKGLRKAKYI